MTLTNIIAAVLWFALGFVAGVIYITENYYYDDYDDDDEDTN